MFSFLQIIVAILIVSAATAYPAQDGLSPGRALLCSVLLLPVPIIWGEFLRFRRQRIRDSFWLRPLAVLFSAVPTMTFAAVVFLAQWPVVVQSLHHPNSESVEYFLLLIPYLFLNLLHWLELYRLERRRVLPLRVFLSHQFRMFLFPLVPFAIYLLGTDILAQFRGLRLLLETVGLVGLAATFLLVLLLLVVLPLSVRYLWKTIPLPPGDLRERLFKLAEKLQFRCRDILVWKTGGLTINAAILGLFSRFRYVILTDGLLNVLGIREVEAVFGHELGHAKRHHVAIFICLAMGSLCLFMLIFEFLIPQTDLSFILATGLFALIWWVLFGYLGRRFELEADLYGVAATGGIETFIEALEKVGAFSGKRRGHGSWRHFSVARRVSFLRQIEFDPDLEKRFVRKLRFWSRGGVALFCVTTVLYSILLFQRVPLEMAEVDLRSGEYQSALVRLQDLEQGEGDVKKLVFLAKLGSSLQKENPEGWRGLLLARGKNYFQRVNFQAARPYLTLAVLLETGDANLSKLQKAVVLLSENQKESFREFLRGEGKSLLEDKDLAPVLRAYLR